MGDWYAKMPTPSTNKTEFARFLDANTDAIGALVALKPTYFKNSRNHNSHNPCCGDNAGDSFGSWLRATRLKIFDHHYKNWWLKRPRLHGKIYDAINA